MLACHVGAVALGCPRYRWFHSPAPKNVRAGGEPTLAECHCIVHCHAHAVTAFPNHAKRLDDRHWSRPKHLRRLHAEENQGIVDLSQDEELKSSPASAWTHDA